MAIVALALAWAGRTAAVLLGPHAPKRKAHGHFAKSWSASASTGSEISSGADPLAAIAAWLRLSPKPLRNRRV